MDKAELRNLIYDEIYKSLFSVKNKSIVTPMKEQIDSYFPESYSSHDKLNFLQQLYEVYFNNAEKEKCNKIKKLIEEIKDARGL